MSKLLATSATDNDFLILIFIKTNIEEYISYYSYL